MRLRGLVFASLVVLVGPFPIGAQVPKSPDQEPQPLVKAQTNAVIVDVVVTRL